MENKEEFRDHLATVDSKGKRIWIYPKKPSGRYFNWRQIVGYFLLAFLFLAPHLKLNGLPLLLFNVVERKFIIFGKVFWPQDFHIFALAMIAGVVFIVLFTVIFGRLFCGWACPQTIFMELVFRRIEYLIEGDWKKQQKLNKEKWNGTKIFKKTLKHVIFWGVSFLIANTFLAYIVGADRLWEIQMSSPKEHLGGLIALAVFTTVFYGVFAFMREQVCTTICPYGRLQGVLLDRKSIVVAYDHKRGEGRSKLRKGEDREAEGKGDCIDCKQCVHVCPTGIDIRNGTQLECVNCTACIDACDEVMDKVGMDRGLIRFESEDGIETGVRFAWTTRTVGYVAVLTLLVGVLVFLIASRSDFEATITQQRGARYIWVDDNTLSNIYDMSLVNKTNEMQNIHLEILNGDGKIENVNIALDPQKEEKLSFAVIMNKELVKANEIIEIGIYDEDVLIDKVKTKFKGPGL